LDDQQDEKLLQLDQGQINRLDDTLETLLNELDHLKLFGPIFSFCKKVDNTQQKLQNELEQS